MYKANLPIKNYNAPVILESPNFKTIYSACLHWLLDDEIDKAFIYHNSVIIYVIKLIDNAFIVYRVKDRKRFIIEK